MKVWKVHALVQYLVHSLLVLMYRNRFGRRGADFQFDPRGSYSYENIFCGDHVSLGDRPCLSATRSRIVIGNHVMLGPEVIIQGGNHRTDVVGRFMKSITDAEKRPDDDRDVIISDDVLDWHPRYNPARRHHRPRSGRGRGCRCHKGRSTVRHCGWCSGAPY